MSAEARGRSGSLRGARLRRWLLYLRRRLRARKKRKGHFSAEIVGRTAKVSQGKVKGSRWRLIRGPLLVLREHVCQDV